MRTSATLLTFTTLLTTILALPTPDTPAVNPISWRVTNFSEGCSPGGCVYQFNIASPNTPSSLGEPAFNTVCHGTNVANKMQPCDNPAITVNELPGSGKFTLVVEHQWTNEKGVTYTVRGNHTEEIGGYPKGFEVPELEVSAIL
ncbi:hypothetical protein VTL71DRAFT_1879 [Oculimacula yallundae]|uniref:Uncharacterized protein n=1 Tax=Oculimacula yallundae TaxID=86028 RepID=A0ABR4CC25_9HELO